MASDPSKPNEVNDPARDQDQDDAVIGRAFLGSILVFVLMGLVIAGSYWYLKPKREVVVEEPTEIAKPEGREKSAVSAPKVKWTDITAQSGLNFVHTSGAKGDKLLPETMGSGCAFLDYNNDGHQDILLVNCCHWDPALVASEPTPIKLYQNDGKGSFTDVTKQAGLEVTVYGMGVACGDYDNDGNVDVYISCLGENKLFKNENGKFVDVTGSTGVAGDSKAWSSACGWFDFDKDNDLDLLVCNYVEWSREFDSAQEFTLVGTGRRAYGRPQNFRGSFPVLYRNDGNGSFTDVSQQA
ncbi:MAG: FG-GAP repeat domain-containing protein, partial [Pirellula sp.]